MRRVRCANQGSAINAARHGGLPERHLQCLPCTTNMDSFEHDQGIRNSDYLTRSQMDVPWQLTDS